MTGTYTVVAGDTLSQIAEKLKIPMDSLVKWNDIKDPSRITVGQVLKLSSGGDEAVAGEPYEVKPGDTFSAIGKKFGVDYNAIMKVNGYEDPTKLLAGSTITIPYRMHTVVAGDTFSELGQKFGVPYQSIMKHNGYEDPTKLRVGAELKIPFS